MSIRHLIGPNGAHIDWDEPLPEWLQAQIDSGEVTEAKKSEAKSTDSKAKATKSKKKS